MNVLFLQDKAGIGGAQLSLLDYLHGIVESAVNIKPFVVLGEMGSLFEKIHDLKIPVEVVEFPHYRKLKHVLRRKSFVMELSAKCTRHQIQIIHANNHHLAPWSALVGRHLGIRSFCTVREILPMPGLKKNRVTQNDGVIAISESTFNEFSPELKNRARQIYNGIRYRDSDLGREEILRKLHLQKMPGKKVVYLGTISERKGPQFLVQAIPDVLRLCPDAAFVFIGGGEPPFVFALKDQVISLGIQDHVTFAGPIENGTVYLKAFDVFVLPSLKEPLGRVTVEAMYAGLPVVGTAAGGTLEIVQDKVTGMLVPPQDPVSIAHAVTAYLQDDELRKQHGNAGRARAIERFSPRNYAEKVAGFYREILNRISS